MASRVSNIIKHVVALKRAVLAFTFCFLFVTVFVVAAIASVVVAAVASVVVAASVVVVAAVAVASVVVAAVAVPGCSLQGEVHGVREL
jgi:hypothetical protein